MEALIVSCIATGLALGGTALFLAGLKAAFAAIDTSQRKPRRTRARRS